MLFVFMGPSGSGKTTIVNMLCEKYKYKSVESYTTRKPRLENEKGHIFITKEEYDALENKIAPVFYSGDYYTVTKSQLKNCDLAVFEPSAVADLIKHNIDFKIIYIDIPEDIRVERMRSRGDAEQKIKERIQNDRKVFVDNNIKKDAVFKNNNLENVVEKINEYIKGLRK